MTTTAQALDLPFDEAIAFLRQKTNTPTERWTDVYGAAHSHSFMVAGAASDALLDDFRGEITKALEKGTTLAEFRAGFDEIVDRHGWEYNGSRGWRTRTIFETNMRTAYSAGRYAQQTLPETLEAFPFWQYNHSGSIHPRLDHIRWDGMVLEASDPFWQTNYPPNGWGCGCFTTPVSAPGLRRQGKSGPDPTPDLVFRAEEVGGTTRRIPQGVDAGFEYNPGQRWLSGGRPSEPVATSTDMRIFGEWAAQGRLPTKTTLPIAEVPAVTLEELGLGQGTRARISVDTLREHSERAFAVVDYASAAAEALLEGLFEGPRGRLSGIIERDGHPHVVGFKATSFGELLVTTLHRSRAQRARRIRDEWRKVGK